MKRFITGILAAAAAAAGAAGCSSSDGPVYYGMFSSERMNPVAPCVRGCRNISLERISLPGSVSGLSIAFEEQNHVIRNVDTRRWSEELSEQLSRALAWHIENGRPGIRVRMSDPDSSAERLSVRLSSFSGRYDGYASVAGTWELVRDGKTLSGGVIRSMVPLAEDGYPSLVAALESAWRAESDKIAQKIAGAAKHER